MAKAKYTKQKDGRYRTAVFTGEYSENGRPISKWLSAKTIKELDEKVAETRHEINVNAFIFDNSTTFGEFSQQWFKTAKKARGEATKGMYENILRICNPLDHECLHEITTMTLQRLVNTNIEHPRTCEQIKLTLKQIFKLALSQKLVSENPANGLELPRHIKKEKRALTAPEIKKLKEADLCLADKAFIHTFYATGMRPGEIYALTKDDIDPENSCIHVNKAVTFDRKNSPSLSYPKTNSGIRSVIVSEALINLLTEYTATIPHQLLFGGEKGQMLKRYEYTGRYNSIMMKVFKTEHRYRDSGIGITPYTFRHNFCTMCYYAGVSLKECQRQMGHSSTKLVLDVYTHCDSLKENTAEKMKSITL